MYLNGIYDIRALYDVKSGYVLSTASRTQVYTLKVQVRIYGSGTSTAVYRYGTCTQLVPVQVLVHVYVQVRTRIFLPDLRHKYLYCTYKYKTVPVYAFIPVLVWISIPHEYLNTGISTEID